VVVLLGFTVFGPSSRIHLLVSELYFNDVLWKMVSDEDEQTKISKQADDYERSEGECFSKAGAIREREKKVLVSN
jgi:hypothetical protein